MRFRKGQVVAIKFTCGEQAEYISPEGIVSCCYRWSKTGLICRRIVKSLPDTMRAPTCRQKDVNQGQFVNWWRQILIEKYELSLVQRVSQLKSS